MNAKFLLYSPLNQGLKPESYVDLSFNTRTFLLYSPLNQGLKHISLSKRDFCRTVFTLQSIKSRIET